MAVLLVVDDEPDILLILRVNLEADGHQVALAADGEHALEHIRRQRFDLVLLDVMMPVMDGWGVLDALGAMADAPPVVVVSAATNQRDMARALEQGAVDYVTKPFESDDLVSLATSLVAVGPDGQERHRQGRLATLGAA